MRSLWDRLMYRMEYHGTHEKDGKVYQKYLKTRRFPRLSKRMVYIALLVFFVSLAFAGLLIWMAAVKSSVVLPETAIPAP